MHICLSLIFNRTQTMVKFMLRCVSKQKYVTRRYGKRWGQIKKSLSFNCFVKLGLWKKFTCQEINHSYFHVWWYGHDLIMIYITFANQFLVKCLTMVNMSWQIEHVGFVWQDISHEVIKISYFSEMCCETYCLSELQITRHIWILVCFYK